jgi:uncharacterized phage-associated protein
VSFKRDIDKILNASLYILGKIPSCDKHKLFKVLYFAEREHLAEYGRPITGDEYKAIKYGPIPTYLTDAIKSVSDYNSFFNYDFQPSDYFELISYYVGAKQKCNLDYLSESDINCIDNAIELLKDKSFDDITKLSHDEAWRVAYEDYDNTINPINMATCAGANFEMIKYIRANMENQNRFHAVSR